MVITVKLFAYFRDNRFISEKRKYPQKTKVQQVIEDLKITIDEIGVTLINGRHCQLDAELSESDSLAIFPMIGGG